MWSSETSNRRYFVMTLVVIACLTPWLVRTSQRSVQSMFNGPPVWIPESVDYRRDYDWFKRVFDERDAVVLQFDDCTVDNELLDQFVRDLFTSDKPEEEARRKELFQFAISGRDLLRELEGDEIELSRQAALARLKGSFIGPDGKTTCILVMLSAKGVYERREAIELIRQTALPLFSIDSSELALVGTAVDGATIDEASVKSISDYSLPSMIVASLLCWWCIRSLLFTCIIFLVALVGQGLVLSLATLSGNPMNAIVVVVPALVFVLTVSSGVHLANYHREAMLTRGNDRDTPIAATSRMAIRNGLAPCLLATLTTIIGTASLYLSQMIPIADFSWLSSVGIAVTTFFLFSLLPYGMDLRTRRLMRQTNNSSNRAHSDRPLQTGRTGRIAEAWVAIVSKLRGWLITFFVIAMMVLAVGGGWLESSVNIRDLLTEDSKLLRDYHRFESTIGPIVPIDILLSFPSSSDTKLLQRFEVVRNTHAIIKQMDEVGSVMSAATFFPSVPSGGGIRRTMIRSTMEAKLNKSIPRFIEGHQYATDEGYEYWRITARVSAVDDIDYGHFLEVLRDRLEPFLANQELKVEAKYTGALPVTYQAQRALLNDLFYSYLTAFSLIALVMTIELRNVWAGLLAMLPNLFPTLLLFGTMGWLGVPVNIGSVMTASVALGIAVDDTLHFLACYRREIASGHAPQTAVTKCMAHCGLAMCHTSFIVALGLAFYCQSEFVPTQRFALMMIGLIAAALIGDIVLLPAILLSRMGNVFLKIRESVKSQSTADDSK